jgi:hypothetical protein
VPFTVAVTFDESVKVGVVVLVVLAELVVGLSDDFFLQAVDMTEINNIKTISFFIVFSCNIRIKI